MYAKYKNLYLLYKQKGGTQRTCLPIPNIYIYPNYKYTSF